MKQKNILLHIPHSSTTIDTSVRSQFVLSDAELQTEILRMTDMYTDELFDVDAESGRKIIYPVSRLVVDPERFTDDAMEPMSKRGMGVIYTATSDGKPLRKAIDTSLRKSLLQTFYYPHHDCLSEAVDTALSTTGSCLIVDCHSFPSVPLPYEMDQSPDRPDICIGDDTFHTPDWLKRRSIQFFEEKGYSVTINKPFSGTLVPMKHYTKTANVHSVMIEVNRSLYMDEITGMKTNSFETIQNHLRSFIKSLAI